MERPVKTLEIIPGERWWPGWPGNRVRSDCIGVYFEGRSFRRIF